MATCNCIYCSGQVGECSCIYCVEKKTGKQQAIAATAYSHEASVLFRQALERIDTERRAERKVYECLIETSLNHQKEILELRDMISKLLCPRCHKYIRENSCGSDEHNNPLNLINRQLF